MLVLDTSMTGGERQLAAFRRTTPERRLAVAAEMSDEIRAVIGVIVAKLLADGRDGRRHARAVGP